jgi:hypothetical protein
LEDKDRIMSGNNNNSSQGGRNVNLIGVVELVNRLNWCEMVRFVVPNVFPLFQAMKLMAEKGKKGFHCLAMNPLETKDLPIVELLDEMVRKEWNGRYHCFTSNFYFHRNG